MHSPDPRRPSAGLRGTASQGVTAAPCVTPVTRIDRG